MVKHGNGGGWDAGFGAAIALAVREAVGFLLKWRSAKHEESHEERQDHRESLDTYQQAAERAWEGLERLRASEERAWEAAKAAREWGLQMEDLAQREISNGIVVARLMGDLQDKVAALEAEVASLQAEREILIQGLGEG